MGTVQQPSDVESLRTRNHFPFLKEKNKKIKDKKELEKEDKKCKSERHTCTEIDLCEE